METASQYRSPLLSSPAAVELTDADTSLIDARGVAWHYGNPLGEQRALAEGSVVIDRSHRAVIKVSGADAAVFLNNLLSQKLVDVTEGFAAAALDLDMQGHVLHHADVTFTDGVFYLDFPAYQHETLTTFLNKMVFWSEVTIEDADLAVLTILGPGPEFAGASEAVVARAVPWPTTPRTDVLVERESVLGVVDKLGAQGIPLAGLMAFTAERVKAGEPELRADMDEKSIPHEAPYLINRGAHLGAVHLDKGCYRGQETVARVENLGRSPRLLVMVQLDGSAPVDPAPGAELSLAGRRVGRLGTVVHDADYGPIALALVKRSALSSGDLTAEGDTPVSASIDPDSLPDDEGEKAGRRAVERLRSSK
ncbi:YgfZ/GcvT domain-containing protein [Corynebacterium qintianiae]|nr:folate-binding protein [Corynebacterium qintianiae]